MTQNKADSNSLEVPKNNEATAITPPLEELVAMIEQETEQVKSLDSNESNLVNRLAAEQEKKTQQFVRFKLGDTLLGIKLSSALEVGQLTTVTPLPNLPHWIVGISNVRGEIVSIIDLKSFFEWPAAALKKNNPLIIVHNHKIKLGILVDRIMGTQNIDPDSEIKHVSFDKTQSTSAPFIKGVVMTKGVPLYVLDMNKLLSSSRMINV